MFVESAIHRPYKANPGAALVFLVLFAAFGIASSLLPTILRLSHVPITQDDPLTSQPLPQRKPIKPDYAIPPVANGLAPLVTYIPTKQPVVFLTIDDGANKQPFELHMLRASHTRATLFLADLFIAENPGFFKPFMKSGMPIENHSISHEPLTALTYDQQKQEICGEANRLQQQFGRRPIFFRPPGGDYNTDTQRAAADCGMKAVINWTAKANGGSMQYQIGDHLNPGDIVLMHFRPEFASDLRAFLDAQKAAGLQTELLQDWLAK